MALIKCSECGESISSSAKTCPHCGVKINLQICPECGAKLKGDETNCPECGYPINKKNATNIITDTIVIIKYHLSTFLSLGSSDILIKLNIIPIKGNVIINTNPIIRISSF